MKWLARLLTKENPTGAAFFAGGAPQWAPWVARRKYVTEGYQANAIVYRCVREIAQAVADIEINVHQVARRGQAPKVMPEHPALDLLWRPNPRQGYGQWVTENFIHWLIFGEIAITGAPREARIPTELWNLNPSAIKVLPGAGGIARGYEHEANGVKTFFPVDPATGRSSLFFLRQINPDDYWRGQSPLQAAALAADIHNAGGRWNYGLLRNGARPSGMVKFPGTPDAEDVAKLKEWFQRDYQGPDNAGAVGILHGGAEFAGMGATPKDMDFMNSQREAAKMIASAFGVPLPLIDNDASTFNNLEIAKERFYTDTVIPQLRQFLVAFGEWLLPAYGPNLYFAIDMDSIAALESVRTRTYDRVIKAKTAGIITADEAREAMGYPELTPAQRAELDPVGVAIEAAREGGETEARSQAKLAYGTQAH